LKPVVKAKSVVSRAQALRDLDGAITHDIAEDAEPAALGFIDTLEKAYWHLARDPSTRSSRYAHELNLPGLRAWPMAR
jgi:toxin ParE1/3/4